VALPQVLKLDSPGLFDNGDATDASWDLASPTTPRQDESTSYHSGGSGGGEDTASFMPFSPSR